MLEAQSYTEGVDARQSLSFIARSVLIENYSQSWAWIESAQRFCPPLRTMTCELTSPTDVAAVTWRNPPGNITPGPAGNPKGILNAYWTDARDKNSIPQPIYVGQTGASVINTVAVATNTFAVPQGTIALGVDTASVTGETIQLTGSQSTITYCNEFVRAADGVLVFPLDPGDTTVVFTSSAGRLIAFPFSPPMPIQPGTLDLPLFVKNAGDVVSSAANVVGSILSGNTSVDGATIITIPAGHAWRGTVGVSGSSSNTGASSPDVEIGTGNGNPAVGVILTCAQVAQNAAGSTGANETAVSPDIYVLAGFAATTLILKVHNSPVATGWANGVLIS